MSDLGQLSLREQASAETLIAYLGDTIDSTTDGEDSISYSSHDFRYSSLDTGFGSHGCNTSSTSTNDDTCRV